MEQNVIKCPRCGEEYSGFSYIVCPKCGQDMSDATANGKGNKKYNLFTAYGAMYAKMFDFKTRSRRSEFWYAYLLHTIIGSVLYGAVLWMTIYSEQMSVDMVDMIKACNFLFNAYSILTVIPIFALMVRRLHDTGRSAIYALLEFLAPVGTLVLLVLMAFDGNPCPNRYGPDPKGRGIEMQW